MTVNAVTRAKNERLQKENEIKQHNIESYQGIVSGLTAENRVLVLKMDDVAIAHDRLLNRLDSVSKAVDLKLDKAIAAAATEETIIINTVDTVNVKEDKSFTKVIKPNDLTTIKIEFNGKDSLTHELEIRNSRFLWISPKKVYKNTNKSWFKRLVTFDWKKRTVYDYVIKDTNPLIKIDETRVIINEDYVKE